MPSTGRTRWSCRLTCSQSASVIPGRSPRSPAPRSMKTRSSRPPWPSSWWTSSYPRPAAVDSSTCWIFAMSPYKQKMGSWPIPSKSGRKCSKEGPPGQRDTRPGGPLPGCFATLGRAAARRARRGRFAGRGGDELGDRRRIELAEPSALQSGWQPHRAEANPHQTAHRIAHRCEHPADLPIAALLEDDPIPVIAALPAFVGDRREAGAPVLEQNALAERAERFRAERSAHPHRVLAFGFVARVREPGGELAGSREKQEPARVEVEPTDGDPAPAPQPRQAVEDRWASFRVVDGDDFPGRLVVEEHARADALPTTIDRPPVELDAIARRDALTEVRSHAVHRDPPRRDPRLHLAARAEAGAREDFLELLGGRGGTWRVAGRRARGRVARRPTRRRPGRSRRRPHPPAGRSARGWGWRARGSSRSLQAAAAPAASADPGRRETASSWRRARACQASRGARRCRSSPSPRARARCPAKPSRRGSPRCRRASPAGDKR